MNSIEIFKREMSEAGFEIEVYQGKPAIRVQPLELEDALKLISVPYVKKDCHRFYLIWPE